MSNFNKFKTNSYCVGERHYSGTNKMALFSSVKLETSGGRTIEYIEHCHPNLFN